MSAEDFGKLFTTSSIVTDTSKIAVPQTSGTTTQWSTTFPDSYVGDVDPISPSSEKPDESKKEEFKFFLHDEMILWLKQNLKVEYTEKLGVGNWVEIFPGNGMKMTPSYEISIKIGDEYITKASLMVDNYPVISALSFIQKGLMAKMIELETKLEDLRRQSSTS